MKSASDENEPCSQPSFRETTPHRLRSRRLRFTMTNQDDKVPFLYVDHNAVKKTKQERKNQENKFSSKRVGLGLKPTMELYRPPKNNQKNGTKVHFMPNPPISSGSPQPSHGELKSALKRSKSFTGSDKAEPIVPGFDRDAFPQKYLGLIRRAMIDPNILDFKDLMEVVRVICGKAVESIQNALPAAVLCFSIIEKENANVFLESLLNACQEWFNERDKLLRCQFLPNSGIMNMVNSGGSRRWTAYVYFLTELYRHMRDRHRQSLITQMQIGNACSANSTSLHTLTLAALLFECCLVILKPPALYNAIEIESFRMLLTTVGKQLEEDAPSRMQQVMDALRDAFVNPSVTAQIRKTILEMVELHASNWRLDLPQSIYYYPYTNMDRG